MQLNIDDVNLSEREYLKRAEERADTEGWIDADDLEKELGVLDICFSGQTA